MPLHDQGRAWSEDQCGCGCPMASITGCGPGLTFDNNSTCACVPLPGPAAGQSDGGHAVQGDPEPGLTWETVLIISLGSLLLILACIVLGLLVRLSSLRRAGDTKTALVPSTLSGQYFPCADPCSDISLARPGSKVSLNIAVFWLPLHLQKMGLSAESDSDSDRGKMLTDSSLCSDQVRDHVKPF